MKKRSIYYLFLLFLSLLSLTEATQGKITDYQGHWVHQNDGEYKIHKSFMNPKVDDKEVGDSVSDNLQ